MPVYRAPRSPAASPRSPCRRIDVPAHHSSSSEQILLGILALSLLTIVMNRVMVIGRSQVQLLIFSPEYERIRELILGEQDAGATMLPIEQGYTRTDSKAVLCVIPRRKLWPMREMINTADPHAFWVISEVSEVRARTRPLHGVATRLRQD
ncbi:YitT family protein [Collinsella tanakaei]|nr:YitT family protein [Collinsella tanakaei]